MASVKTKEIVYEIEVQDNKCTEVGAGGVAFAYGIGHTADPWVAEWYKNHEGYSVKEVETEEREEAPKK